MEPLQTQALPCRSISPLVPRSLSGSGRKTNSVLASSRSGRENTPPNHSNVQIDRSSSFSSPKKTLNQCVAPIAWEKTVLDGPKDGSVPPSDDSVKVVVRIRPDQEKGSPKIVQRISLDSLSVGDRTYSFDSILNSGSSQEDVFNLIGIPLVKNSLAGFNNSIVAYGQSGTGKTYTMWGPPSAMVEGPGINSLQGIVPRIFNLLFSEIYEKKKSSGEVQTNFQCRCSFLEVYREQINDLLDPTQRNLLIRDDARNAFQVENLSEEYVNTIEDVTQLLVKGLSNRKVGATSVNSKSSRSHIIFTCVVESWCKGLSSNFFSSSKASRINFVDLAGNGSYNLDKFRRQSIQEEQFIKNSLSKFGRLVNILSDSTHLKNDEKVPHADSCLTNVLQDTLGGNAKVTFICAIFPDERYKAITLSTLRFGGRAKQMKNKAMINEISEDDVNGLSDQIRQLKEELINAKSGESNSFVSTDGYFKRHNTRESLILLRRSLNRSLFLPSTGKELEADIDVGEEEDDARELCLQLNHIQSSMEEHAEESEVTEDEKPNTLKVQYSSENSSPCKQSPLLEEPVFCSSPKARSSIKKNTASETPKHKVDSICSSLQSSKVRPIESLAASLHRGLQIIDYHQQSSACRKSPVALSFEHLSLISSKDVHAPFLCSACRKHADIYGPAKEFNKEELEGSEDASQRNAELEALCTEQAEKIKELDSQIDMYRLRKELKSSTNASLLEEIRNGSTLVKRGEEFESEKNRWMESESRWISITEELRMDLELNRRLAEKKEVELNLEKQCTAELDDALHRSILGHTKIIEHYVELQDKYNELLSKHRKVMEGIAEVKKAAVKAGSKHKGSAFATALSAELATSRIERERERTILKEQNRVLKLQLRDTAEAVQAAGELLVRLKEAEETVSVSEEKYGKAQQEIERLRRQIDKLKKKHTMEIATMKHYLAESRLPESALEPLYQQASDSVDQGRVLLTLPDDISWSSAFRPSYQ